MEKIGIIFDMRTFRNTNISPDLKLTIKTFNNQKKETSIWKLYQDALYWWSIAVRTKALKVEKIGTILDRRSFRNTNISANKKITIKRFDRQRSGNSKEDSAGE